MQTLVYAFLVINMVMLLNSVFSLDIRSARIFWKRLKTSSMICPPKWLTSIGSATDLMHCARLYPLSLTDSHLSDSNSTPFQSSRGFQFTWAISTRLITNDPSLRTSSFTSDGDGVYWGMLKLSNSSSFIIPCTYSCNLRNQYISKVHWIQIHGTASSSSYLHTHITKSHSHKLPNKVPTLTASWILGFVFSPQNCENHATFFNQFLRTTLEKTREISLKLVVVSSRNIWWACCSYVNVPPVVVYTLRNLSINHSYYFHSMYL